MGVNSRYAAFLFAGIPHKMPKKFNGRRVS